MARIDRDDRARAVYDAAFQIMSRGGYSALTLRQLADALGGSMTLVTHYFPTQADLMRGVLDRQLSVFEDELAGLETSDDPTDRLRILLKWFLPIDDESWSQERARVLLAIQAGPEDSWMREHLDIVDTRMRALIASHLEPLVAPEDLALATDVVRLLLNGVVLSAVEHRNHWAPDRQQAVVDLLWAALPWRAERAAIA